jgi:hypothetical protein
MATIQLRLDAVNTACCTADAPCADGLPAACNIQCAIIYTKFYDECCAQPTAFSLSSASLRLSSSNSSASNHAVVIRVRLDHLLMGLIDEATNPGASAVFDDFQTDCLSSFDPRSLLDVISSAQCCSGASNGHDLAAANPLSDHSCDANSGGPGATWYQIDEQMTDHASGVAYCASQGASLCPRSRYCVQGVGAPPVGGRRSGDKWAPTSDGDNTWIQVGTWGGADSNTCMFHHDLAGGIYGKSLCCYRPPPDRLAVG